MNAREPAQDRSALIGEATALCRRGDLDAAAAICAAILDGAADDVGTLCLFGQIRCQQGRFEDAIALLRRSLAAQPAQPRAELLLGRALAETGVLEPALAHLDRAIAADGALGDAHGARGDVLGQLGRHAEAVASYRQAIALDPSGVANWCNLGAAYAALGELEPALDSYARALTLDPTLAEAHFNRAGVLARLGRAEEALASLEQGLTAAPDHVGGLVAYADMLRSLDRHGEAVAVYDRVLTRAPGEAVALAGRAASLAALKRVAEALATLDRLLAVSPDDADTLSNRGLLLTQLNRHDEALASLERALRLDPANATALNNRAMVLLDLGRPAAAVRDYRAALALRPSAATHSNLIFALNFDPAADAAVHQAERAAWQARYARLPATTWAPHRNPPDPERRLRIGYLSSHFRHQAATYAFAGVILARDREAFEAVCYANTEIDDAVGERFRASADAWRPVGSLSDDALADLIRRDEIDILVDLVGHMSGQRLLVFARKPAPLQLTGWGEPTGTGLAAMDYLLADPVLVPQAERGLLAERVCDLPNFLGYWMPDVLPEAGPLPASVRGHVTFGSFNRIAKIQDPVLRLWAGILQALPSARLIIKSEQRFDNSIRRREIEAIFAAAGVAMSRVDLRGPCDRLAHFQAYRDIDIALDPFPHGGGMTTLDALWMGVPVVTAPGRTISSRLAAASQTALGLADWIAASDADYVERAVGMTRDLDALARLRAELRPRLRRSPFGDPAQYARAVEAAYRAMWRTWCREQGRDRR